MRNLAKRIIACETDGDSSAGAKMPDAFHVFEKLRPQLVPLMGKGGFRALISRALREARVEAPWLRAIQVKTNGNLAGLKEIQALLSLDAIYVGRVALLAQVLGQLVAFIGENLMSRMVLRVWPQAA